jgi:uncharacterized delta-60 repeat protein
MGRKARARRLIAGLIGLVAVALLVSSATAGAQPLQGELDRSFGVDGRAFSQLGESFASGEFTSLVRQPDGKLVLAESLELEDRWVGVIERREPDGTLDPGFGNGGTTLVDRPVRLAMQADGTVLYAIQGARGRCSAPYLRRLQPNGNPDRGFGSSECGVLLPLFPTQIAVQPNGGILVAGASPFCPCGHVNPPTQLAVARFHADGSLDTTFGTDGVLNVRSERKADDSAATALAVREDGTILVAGDKSLMALTPDGTLSPGFGDSGVVDTGGRPEAMAVPADGGALVAVNICCSGSDRLVLIRYRVDGSPEPGFGSSGRLGLDPISEVKAMALAPDGGIILAGQVSGPVNCRGDECHPAVIARITTVGSLDRTFGSSGLVLFPNAPFGDDGGPSLNALAISPAGQVLAAGGDIFSADAFVVARQANGQPDGSFGSGGTVDEVRAEPSTTEASSLAVGPGGEIVVAAWSDTGVHANRAILAGWTANGHPDLDVGSGAGFAAAESGQLIRPAGHEQVYAVNGHDVVRLDLDGQRDPAYGANGRAGLPPQFAPWSFTTRPNGNVIVIGRVGDHPGIAVFQLDSNGHRERSFGRGGLAFAGLGREAKALAVAVDRGGRIVLVGRTHRTGRPVVVRLLPDGRLDRRFGRGGRLGLGIPYAEVASIAIQPGGGILVAAGPRRAGPGWTALVRLNRDGTRDLSFGKRGALHPPHRSALLVSLFAYRRQIVLVTADAAFTKGGVTLRAYTPRGRPDLGFGHHGVLTAAASGKRIFRPSAAARQPSGRIVVVGTAHETEGRSTAVELLRFR